jgi:tetratricopeptide (TPR) repeat protein
MVLLAHQFRAEAETCFERAEQLDPREPRWPYHLGGILSERDASAGIRKWERAVELAGDQGLRLRLADALLVQGRHAEARSQLEHVLQGAPEGAPWAPLAHLGLARLALAEGDLADSRRHLERCTTSRFTRKAAHTLLAALEQRVAGGTPLRQRAEQEARTAAGLPEDVPPPNPFAEEVTQLRKDRRSLLQQADRLLTRGRVREGLGLLGELVGEHPDFEPAWQALGYALLQQHAYADAERALATAVRLAPDSAAAHYYLGCVAFNQGRHGRAEECFREAVRIKPDYALAYYNLGQSLKQRGDRRGALEAFRTAVRCRPDLATAHAAIAELRLQIAD